MSQVPPKFDAEVIRENIQALFQYIQRVRVEIAALNRDADGINKFTTMGEQLDAIVESTKDATDVIMDAVEKNNETIAALEKLIKDDDQAELLNRIADTNNAVFEACAFQDLTGQRVSKIVKSVTYVEDRVNALIESWGREELEKVEIETFEVLSEEEKLLHGPQLKADAISQDEIDKLFD